MEQILCFDTAVDAEKFCNEKSAIFVVLPEEDTTKYFMVSSSSRTSTGKSSLWRMRTVAV